MLPFIPGGEWTSYATTSDNSVGVTPNYQNEVALESSPVVSSCNNTNVSVEHDQVVSTMSDELLALSPFFEDDTMQTLILANAQYLEVECIVNEVVNSLFEDIPPESYVTIHAGSSTQEGNEDNFIPRDINVSTSKLSMMMGRLFR